MDNELWKWQIIHLLEVVTSHNQLAHDVVFHDWDIAKYMYIGRLVVVVVARQSLHCSHCSCLSQQKIPKKKGHMPNPQRVPAILAYIARKFYEEQIQHHYLRTILGIINWDPSVSKSNRLHVDIFWFLLIWFILSKFF